MKETRFKKKEKNIMENPEAAKRVRDHIMIEDEIL